MITMAELKEKAREKADAAARWAANNEFACGVIYTLIIGAGVTATSVTWYRAGYQRAMDLTNAYLKGCSDVLVDKK